VVRDRRRGAEAREDRHRQIEGRAPQLGLEPASLLRQAPLLDRRPPFPSAVEPPHDRQDRHERELKRDLHRHAGPDEPDQQRRQGEAAENLLLAVEQHRAGVNPNHDRRAHGGNHRSGQTGVENDRQKRRERRDLEEVEAEQQERAEAPQAADQKENDRPEHRHMNAGDREDVSDAGGRGLLPHLPRDASHVAHDQRLEKRRVFGREVSLEEEADLAAHCFHVDPGAALGATQQLDSRIVRKEGRSVDAAAREVSFVVEAARIARIARRPQSQPEAHPVSVPPLPALVSNHDQDVSLDLFRPARKPDRLRPQVPAGAIGEPFGFSIMIPLDVERLACRGAARDMIRRQPRREDPPVGRIADEPQRSGHENEPGPAPLAAQEQPSRARTTGGDPGRPRRCADLCRLGEHLPGEERRGRDDQERRGTAFEKTLAVMGCGGRGHGSGFGRREKTRAASSSRRVSVRRPRPSGPRELRAPPAPSSKAP
jgi:hypothetical protein